jgi:cell division protein FtsA
VIGIRGREITPDDRIRAVDSAKATYMPLDREVLHVIPSGFVLDGEQGITDPVGMSGVRLESRVYIITAQAQAVQDLEQSCRTAGLEVLAMVFSPAATALATLTRDEIVRGAVLIDIGGGTTDIAVFRNSSLVHAAVVGIGGLHLTNDLAVCLNVDVADAERLKITAGAACGEAGHGGMHVGSSLPADAARAISKSHLVSVIQPRCEELFELVRQEMRRAFPQVPSPRSAVLTGGTAYLNNMSGLAASILGMPARLGMPQGKFGIQGSLRNPACAAAIGLLAYAFEHSVLDRMTGALPGSAIGNIKKRVTDLTGYKDFLEMLQKKKKGVSYV